MSMGRRKRESQGRLWVEAGRVARGPAHPFYRRLNEILDQKGFDEFVEGECQRFFAERMGRPSLPPGVYFRLLLIGYFEGIDSERGIAWREADRALAVVREWAEGAELELHPEKTQIVDATQPGGFDFLGYHFERGYRWPRKKSLKKLKDNLRAKTKRTRGDSLAVIVDDVNRTLRGWWQYFQHSHYTTFKPLDGWLRMRLRSILRKRQRGKKGRGRGRDHQRWPNAFFAEVGLFSLERAYESACQSSRR
jgi:hypothetical protein